MIYANAEDVKARIYRELSQDEEARLETMLEDAGVIIDATAPRADFDAKRLVSCRMVIRALGNGDEAAIAFPLGANQGSMSALGYQQQWTLPAGGGTGELYIGKTERQILGLGHKIGAHSPLEALTYDPCNHHHPAGTRADRC